MFNEISTRFLGNSELISMLMILSIIIFIAAWIYKKLPEDFSDSQPSQIKLPEHCRKSRSFKKLQIKDMFWIILISLCYSIVSLWNLGSFASIGSYWQPVSDYEEVILELSESQFDAIYWIAGEGNNNTNPSGYQNHVDFQVHGSNDLNEWIYLTTLNNINYLKIQKNEGSWDQKYIKILSFNRNNVLNEIGFRKTGTNEFIEATVHSSSNSESEYSAEALIDEQNALVSDPSYINETFFDEIYHTRNAQEIAEHQYMYAFVHPLLGTQLIALGIQIFGLSPFGWRIMGALFGIFMIPLLYLCALHLFHNRKSAILASILLGAECMHYTTSRIGTLEPFSIFFILASTYFMLKYVQTSFYDTPLKQQFVHLAFSGIFMGMACATKFTGVYAGIGLAVLFFSSLFQRGMEYGKSSNKKSKSKEDLTVIRSFWPNTIKTGLWCILFFVLIPLGIYIFSYVPIVIHKGEPFSIKAVYDQTMSMYDYHKNLDATHPYQSVWWQWILDLRPVWYYVKYNTDTMNTISVMGNPLIFWSGAVSMIWCFYDAIKNRSHRAVLISIAYLAQLVFWMSVERCIFIYHYYPSVPFLILGIVHASESLLKKDLRYQKPILILTSAAVILFFLFLPVTGGFTTTSWFVQHFLRWMSSWYFG